VDQQIGDCDRLRWLAYFDLLGVKALLAAGQEGRVFNAYWAAQHEFKNHREWAPKLTGERLRAEPRVRVRGYTHTACGGGSCGRSAL
jgi:hypothetical protein